MTITAYILAAIAIFLVCGFFRLPLLWWTLGFAGSV